MLRICIISLLTLILVGCATVKPVPLSTQDLQKLSNNFSQNTESEISNSFAYNNDDNVDPNIIADLLKAEFAYNQGNYDLAYQIYYQLAIVSHNPIIVYKAILSNISMPSSAPPDDINKLITLFTQSATNTKFAKLLDVIHALGYNNLLLAQQKLDELLIDDNSDNNRGALIFLTITLSKIDNQGMSSEVLNSFANYVFTKYHKYPEAYIFSTTVYARTNNTLLLTKQLKDINYYQKDWNLPLYLALNTLLTNNNYSTIVECLKQANLITYNQNTYNIYLLSLMKLNQLAQLQQLLLKSKYKNNVILVLALGYLEQGHYDLALYYFNHTTNFSQESETLDLTHLTTGIIYQLQNSPESAIKSYQAIKNVKFNAIATNLLMNIYLSESNFSAIDAIFNQLAIDNNLSLREKLLLQANFYTINNQYKMAENLLNNKLFNGDKSVDYLQQMAILATQQHHNNYAINIYQKLIKLHPESAEFYNDIAYIYATTKSPNLSKMYHYAKIAYRLDANDPNILDTLGWVYYRLGKYYQAVFYLQLSLLKNYNTITAEHLAKTYIALKQIDLAKQINLLSPQQIETNNQLQMLQGIIKLWYVHLFSSAAYP
jgi:Tfp pilus assembly protein PilF